MRQTSAPRVNICITGATFDTGNMGVGALTAGAIECTLQRWPGASVFLLDYGKSTTLETPHIEIEHHPVPDPYTTLGQKAAGEGAAIPSPAAIASAVEDALSPFGVRIRRLPLSAERVWDLIHGHVSR